MTSHLHRRGVHIFNFPVGNLVILPHLSFSWTRNAEIKNESTSSQVSPYTFYVFYNHQEKKNARERENEKETRRRIRRERFYDSLIKTVAASLSERVTEKIFQLESN